MIILNEKPPIYDRCIKVFNLDEKQPFFFSYGDAVYNPKGVQLSPDVIKHEQTHLEQQGYSRVAAKIWWDIYFADPNFRAEQEIEAYGEQYKFICQTIKDRNKRSQYLFGFAGHLSGSMYGNCIGHAEAMRRIKDYAEGNDLIHIEDHLKDETGVDL